MCVQVVSENIHYLVSIGISEEVVTEVKRRSEGESLEMCLLEHGNCFPLREGGGRRSRGGRGGKEKRGACGCGT